METNSIIMEAYRTRRVRDASGNEYELGSEISRAEGEYLMKLVSTDNSIVQTLEVGCAYGLASLHICEAIKNRIGASHTIIDPNQQSSYHDVAIAQLERSGFDFFRVIKEPSEVVLPKLLANDSEDFDMVFIDGWHTFDQTMLDLYYANRLIRIGGYVVIDDCDWRSVSAAVAYFSNYPSYELVGTPSLPAQNKKQRIARMASRFISPGLAQWCLPAALYDRVYRRMRFPSMVALKKVAPDVRNWEWFEGF